jgi:protein TonB
MLSKPGAAGKPKSAATKNAPPLNMRSLPAPSSEDQPNSASPVPMTAVLAAPTPALVAPPSPVRQSAGVERGRVISQPRPVYPQAAMRAGIEGSVVLATTIGTDGKIRKVNVVSGHPLLTQAALDAVKQWRYQPSYLNGAPVEVDSSITLNFKRP